MFPPGSTVADAAIVTAAMPPDELPPSRCQARVAGARCGEPAVAQFAFSDRALRPRHFCAQHAPGVRAAMGRLRPGSWKEAPIPAAPLWKSVR